MEVVREDSHGLGNQVFRLFPGDGKAPLKPSRLTFDDVRPVRRISTDSRRNFIRREEKTQKDSIFFHPAILRWLLGCALKELSDLCEIEEGNVK